MLDALKVLFILTGTSTYLVTKYVKVGIEPQMVNSTYNETANNTPVAQIDQNGNNSKRITISEHNQRKYNNADRNEWLYQNRSALGFRNATGNPNDYLKSSTILTHDIIHNSGTHSLNGDSNGKFKNKVQVEEELHEGVIPIGEEDEKNNNSLIKQLERNRNSSKNETRRNGYRFKNWIQSMDGTNPIEKDNENDKLVHTINIIEEDSNIPKLLIKVGTSNETRDVTYFINSSDYDQLDFSRKFKLNSSSGELYLVTPLDRDLPFGRSLWHFSIMAKRVYSKEPFGFADVVIIVNDINDNTPFFERNLYHAQIVENSPSDMSIIQVTATDYDSPVNGNNKIRYLIDRNHLTPEGNTIFAIDAQTGLITSSVCCLDRETNTQFILTVTAVDSGGLKGSTTVIINIIDVNDCGPKFSQKNYSIEIIDGIKVNSTLLYISVTDDDLPTSNQLKYQIKDNSNKYLDLLSIISNNNNSCSVILNRNISGVYDKIIDFNLIVSDGSATQESTDYATLRLIININQSICSNGVLCNNGGYCVKNDDNSHENSYINKSARDLYHCECLNGFEGVFCDLSISYDNNNDIISANKLFQKVIDWLKLDNSALIVILFGFINLLVILLIAFIYRQISHKFDSINKRTTVRSDPLTPQTINNSLTEEQNITTEPNLNEMTVISVPSHDLRCEEMVEELVGDQCPDVVDCCSRVPSRTRHVFISDGNSKWTKEITANCLSLDDIRLYGNDISGLRVWTTTASASMELMDSKIEENVIYV